MDYSSKGFSSKAFIFFILIIITGILLLLRYTNLKSLIQRNVADNPNSGSLKPIPSPTLVEDKGVHSSDGTRKVVMRTKEQGNLVTYSFFVSDIYGKNEKLIFTKILGREVKLSIPQNSWSPDNKYLFLLKEEGGSIGALVFKASGETFANGQPYLDIADLFTESRKNYRITDITGWASGTLIYVTTKGPTFWFEVTSKSFLQLAR